MKTLIRDAVSIAAAAVLVVGCSGSQPPINALGATPSDRAIGSQRSGRATILYAFQGGSDGAYPGGLVMVRTGRSMARPAWAVPERATAAVAPCSNSRHPVQRTRSASSIASKMEATAAQQAV
jgi:hypothetical protein